MKLNHLPLISSLKETLIAQGLENQQLIIKPFHSKQLLFNEADICHHLTFIIEGQLEATRFDETGQYLVVNQFDFNQVIGATLLFSSSPYYLMTISALSHGSILMMHRDFVIEALKDESFCMAFISLISNQAWLLGSKIKTEVQTSLKDRLIGFLKREMQLQGSNTIHLKMTKTDLAKQLAVARTSLSRTLRFMEEEGYIEVNQKKIHIIKKL